MSDRNDEGLMQNGDEILFADETPAEEKKSGASWKVMIVDDEAEVHNVTRMVLEDFTFEGRGLDLISAYSGAEAMDLFRKHPDIAVILLDVVMETDQAGLEMVRDIREKMNNRFVRIILRTGQPGQAPERQVIVEYDINDYKAKSELTSQKLFTALTSAIRSFRDLKIIEKSRQGMEQIIEASANLLQLDSLKQFTAGVLTQLTSLLGLDDSSLFMQTSSFAATHDGSDFYILAGTGQFEEYVNRRVTELDETTIKDDIAKVVRDKGCRLMDDRYIGYFMTRNHSENVLYLKSRHPLKEMDQDLIGLFLSNVALAFDNVYHRENLENLVEERTNALRIETDKVMAAQRVLAKYVPPQLTERILAGEIDEVWDHSRRRLTLFFSDIKDFTKLAEVMEPEDMAALLNEYLSEMYEIANRAGGVVATVMGDGLFIFFGAPETFTDKEHAVRCVKMAFEMQQKMKDLQVKWFEDGVEEPLEIRCGINTGMANVGGFGSKARREYTAMGLQVNLASRLEGKCEPGKILISHSTWGLVKDEFECKPKGKIEVKGFSHPVRTYEITVD